MTARAWVGVLIMAVLLLALAWAWALATASPPELAEGLSEGLADTGRGARSATEPVALPAPGGGRPVTHDAPVADADAGARETPPPENAGRLGATKNEGSRGEPGVGADAGARSPELGRLLAALRSLHFGAEDCKDWPEASSMLGRQVRVQLTIEADDAGQGRVTGLTALDGGIGGLEACMLTALWDVRVGPPFDGTLKLTLPITISRGERATLPDAG